MHLSVQPIHGPNDPLFASFRELYEASFPEYQRRRAADQAAAFEQPAYRLDAWLADDEFAAFMSWWDFPDIRYVEHLAVSPDKRSTGIGRKLLQAWLPTAVTPVALEIDPVVDELTGRRLAFYQRVGFAENPAIKHTVPSLIECAVMTPGELLTWPRAISQAEYQRFQAQLQDTAFACIGLAVE